VDDGPDVYLFSADCGGRKSMPGGKIVHGKLRLYKNYMMIYFGLSLDEMAGRLISGVRDLVGTESSPFVRCRAGGVVLDGDALVLPSGPERHLPALVASLVRSGGAYLGDEIVHIEPVLRQVHSAPFPLLVDGTDLELFPELDREQARKARWVRYPEGAGATLPRRPIRVEELNGDRGAPSDVRWIVFPSFEPGSPDEIEPLSRAEGIFRLSQAFLNMHIWTDRALVLARDLVENARIARMRVGSITEGTGLLHRMVMEGR
jgi:hypothetical protein